jgi:hypothetical protein
MLADTATSVPRMDRWETGLPQASATKLLPNLRVL